MKHSIDQWKQTETRPEVCTRRDFICRATLAVAGAGLFEAGCSRSLDADSKPLFTGIGITTRLDRVAESAACGADYIAESVARFLMPDQPESVFAEQRKLAAAAPIPVRGCNSFLRDRRLRCVGPDADHPRVLAFAETAFRRLSEVGGEFIGFGSNTARQIPDGWPRERAGEQFVELLRAMGPLAEKHNIVVSVESQRTAECNYLNHISEVLEVVVAANHPNIRVLADVYHMAVMGDTAAEVEQAGPWVGLVEIAEKENRTLPGMAGDDFRPYFAALARGGYSGLINIEGNGSTEQLTNAFATVRHQAEDASASPAQYLNA